MGYQGSVLRREEQREVCEAQGRRTREGCGVDPTAGAAPRHQEESPLRASEAASPADTLIPDFGSQDHATSPFCFVATREGSSRKHVRPSQGPSSEQAASPNPFYSWGDRGTKMPRHQHEVTQPEGGRGGIWTQAHEAHESLQIPTGPQPRGPGRAPFTMAPEQESVNSTRVRPQKGSSEERLFERAESCWGWE